MTWIDWTAIALSLLAILISTVNLVRDGRRHREQMGSLCRLDVHAVDPRALIPGTMCGLVLRPGVVSTGWGRPLLGVVAGVTCFDCLTRMGISRVLGDRA